MNTDEKQNGKKMEVLVQHTTETKTWFVEDISSGVSAYYYEREEEKRRGGGGRRQPLNSAVFIPLTPWFNMGKLYFIKVNHQKII